MVVKVHPDGKANLKAFLDGDPLLWVLYIAEGPGPGQFQWPVREDAGSPVTVRYHQLFNLGDYRNESMDIERTFTAGTSSFEALKTLKIEVLANRQKMILQEQQMERYQRLQLIVADAETKYKDLPERIAGARQELETLKAALGIHDEAATAAATVETADPAAAPTDQSAGQDPAAAPAGTKGASY
jgi:hypothetical protein